MVKFFKNVGTAGSEKAENENVNKSRNGDTLGPVKQMGWSVGCHGIRGCLGGSRRSKGDL